MDYDSHTHVDEIFDDDLTNKKQEYTVVGKKKSKLFHIKCWKTRFKYLIFSHNYIYKRFLSKEAVYFEAMMGDMMKCLP